MKWRGRILQHVCHVERTSSQGSSCMTTHVRWGTSMMESAGFAQTLRQLCGARILNTLMSFTTGQFRYTSPKRVETTHV